MRSPPYTPPRTVFAVRLDLGQHVDGDTRRSSGVVDHDERRALHALRPSDPGYREQANRAHQIAVTRYGFVEANMRAIEEVTRG